MASDTLKTTIENLAKRYGKHVVVSGNDVPTCRKIATDIPPFDYVAGGGFLVNQNNELYGDMSSLKSYMCYIGMGKFQKYDWGNDTPNVITEIIYKSQKSRSKAEGLEDLTFNEIDKVITRRGYKPKNPVVAKRVALVDMEGTYDRAWGEMLGVDNTGLLYYSDCSMNQAIDIVEALLRDPDVCLVVIDSMSIIGSDSENEKSMEEDQMAANARLWNKAARKLRSALNSNRDATLIAINATSTKVGMTHGDPEMVKNGMMWKLFKSLSIRMNGLMINKGEYRGQKDVALGRNVSLINKKNKFGTPFRTSDMYFSLVDDGVIGKGRIDVTASLVNLGIQFDIIERRGNTYQFGKAVGTGIENFKTKLNDTGELQKLREQVYAQF